MNNSTRKIKVIGKICRILSSIMAVLMIIGTSMLVLAGIVLIAIPQESIAADVEGSADVTVYGDWVDKMTDKDFEKISEKVEEGSFSLRIRANKVNGIEREGNSVVLHAEGGAMHLSLRKIGFALLCYALIPGALIAVFITLRKLMRALETEESPFSDKVVKKMTGFAISLIPYALLKPTFGKLGTMLMTSGDFDIHFGVDLSTAFAALVIILIIMIFKYGAAIQKESDETL
ncbi:MAG: DUF2975 domain-containing protein [Clostridia bacterium]|nr:DUF2975 domain-containing protein [Clostridia bacterium]